MNSKSKEKYMDFIDDVKKKLDIIDELFPSDRIEKSKERWRRLWNREPILDRIPFTYSPIKATYWSITPKEERLMMYLDEFILRGSFNDDFIPSYFAGCHQGGMASLFGAETFVVDNKGELDTNCVRLLPEIKDAETLEPPRFRGDTIPERWLSDDAWVIEVTNGRLPVHIVDCFGPVDIAAKLWGFENLFVASYDEPELYKKVVNYSTDAFIMFIEAQRKCAGDLLIETHLGAHDWVETGKTISMSMDCMVMFSTPFFEDNCVPYLKKIADTYSPFIIHACGQFGQLIKYICDNPNFNGIHTGEMTLAEMIEAGGNDGVLYIPAGVNLYNLEENTGLLRQHKLSANMTINGFWENNSGNWSQKDIDKMKKNHEEIVIPLLS